MIADAHSMKAPGVHRPERFVAVADQVSWCFAPRIGFCHLTRNPLRRWIAGNRDSDEPSAGVSQNHKTIEQLE
jgi:hypothetical protein